MRIILHPTIIELLMQKNKRILGKIQLRRIVYTIKETLVSLMMIQRE